MTLEESIVQVMKEQNKDISARELARILNVPKSDINHILYKHKGSKFIKQSNGFTWTLAKGVPVVNPIDSPTSSPKARTKDIKLTGVSLEEFSVLCRKFPQVVLLFDCEDRYYAYGEQAEIVQKVCDKGFAYHDAGIAVFSTQRKQQVLSALNKYQVDTIVMGDTRIAYSKYYYEKNRYAVFYVTDKDKIPELKHRITMEKYWAEHYPNILPPSLEEIAARIDELEGHPVQWTIKDD